MSEESITDDVKTCRDIFPACNKQQFKNLKYVFEPIKIAT